MNELEEQILATIKRNNLIDENDKIVLGVSGGPDSMCMLNALINIIKNCNLTQFQETKNCNSAQLQEVKKCNLIQFQKAKNCSSMPFSTIQIVVCHVNHKIRAEADSDEQYVKDFCKKNGIKFFSKSIDVQNYANTNKIGTEEAGRIVRYDFFDEICKKTGANKIAIAHNKNDKVETMIMNALRGSGISGLKGIESKRGKYIRPLIDCERTQIEQYCKEQKLEPRIDKTNFENEYTRNKIRNIVIPYIKKEFNPNVIATLDRLSNLVIEEENYIEEVVEKTYGNLLLEDDNEKKVLNLKEFNKQKKVIKSRVLLYTITRLFGSSKGIEKVHIEDIIKLCENNIGNKYLTPNKNLKVLVNKQKIYFYIIGK